MKWGESEVKENMTGEEETKLHSVSRGVRLYLFLQTETGISKIASKLLSLHSIIWVIIQFPPSHDRPELMIFIIQDKDTIFSQRLKHFHFFPVENASMERDRICLYKISDRIESHGRYLK